jgi:hypothetical protein
MSDELRLPDDLAACEARLAAMPLGVSRIDRDEMLYRAGWAAGAETARLATRRDGAFRLRSLAMCSAASAALAASLAVAITLRVDAPVESESLIVNSEAAEHRPDMAMAEPTEEMPNRRPPARAASDLNGFLARFASGAAAGDGPSWLALRRGIPLAAADDPPTVVNAAVFVPPEQAKTARQLLEELLPASHERSETLRRSRLWPFGASDNGDTI